MRGEGFRVSGFRFLFLDSERRAFGGLLRRAGCCHDRCAALQEGGSSETAGSHAPQTGREDKNRNLRASRISGFGFRVSGFRFRVSGFGFRVSGFGFRISGFGFGSFIKSNQMQSPGWRGTGPGPARALRVPGSGFRVSGLGSRVSGLGFRVSGSGFRIPGFGFRVKGSTRPPLPF